MQEETTISNNAELKIPTTMKALIEALIFAAREPLSIAQLRTIYNGEGRQNQSQQLDAETIRSIVNELNKEYEQADRPYRIITIAGGFQFATRSEYADWLGRLHKEQGRKKLSQSGIETLAIIAYKQPITKAEIEKIRGVNCDYVLKTLLEKELITVTGRAEAVGRPLLYGTTREFLKHFGLNDITDLPRPREIEEILGESQFETERRMLEAQAAADAMKKEQEEFKSRLPHIPKKKAELEQKPAQIVSRLKIREIKIVKKSENLQQESINFDQDKPKEDVPVITHEDIQKNELTDGNRLNTDNTKIIIPQQSLQTDTVSAQEINVEQQIVDHSGSDVQEHGNHLIPETNQTTKEEISESTVQKEADVVVNSVEIQQSDNLETNANDEQQHFEPVDRGVNSVEQLSTPDETTDIRYENTNELTGPGIEVKEPTHKTRWQVWKEKIQGFIRKLFV